MPVVWPELIALLVVCAELAASVHILLRKKDVRGAVGWLGLVWLAPVLGLVLYGVLGINRIQRRAHGLYASHQSYVLPNQPQAVKVDELHAYLPKDQDHLLPLATLTERVVGQPLLKGNSVDILVNGDSAYPAMLESIRNARDSIGLSTYIFDNDHCGETFIQALGDAVTRGVTVRVLIDAVGARYSFPSVLRDLRRHGVTCARFMPSLWPWRFRYANLRNHRKILVCDGRTGYTGGMNIRGGNVLNDRPEHPIADLHFRLRGPVVAELQRSFADDWLFATGERLVDTQWFPVIDRVGDAVCRGIPDGPDEDFEKIHNTIAGACACAEERIDVLSPYFLPDERLIAALKIAALRGVYVRIIVPERSNLRPVQWASMPGLVELLDAGCQILLSPAPFDHGKLLLVDRAWVLFGSANIDSRSLVLNFEFNIECYGAGFARQVLDVLEARVRLTKPLSREQALGRSLAAQLRNRFFRLFSPYL